MDNIIFQEIKDFDRNLIEKIKELEIRNLGKEASINQWVIPVIIRYGKFIAAIDRKSDSGIIGVCQIIREWKEVNCAFMHSFYIDSKYRGRGIGKELLEKTTDILKKEGFDAVELTVGPDNRAAGRLYRKLGFKEIGLRKDEYGRGIDRILMRLEL